jgi:hypothetical protein
MRTLQTLLAVLVCLALIPGCGGGTGPGPTSEQRAEAQEIQRDFSALRSEAEARIQELHARGTDHAEMQALMLEDALDHARDSVERLQRAPRAEFSEWRGAAQSAIDGVREMVDLPIP